MTHLHYRRLFISTLGIIAISNVVSLAMFVLIPGWFYYRPWEYFDELAYWFENFDASLGCEREFRPDA